MKYFAETEKAVKLQIAVEYVDAEFTKRYFVWVPKSQLEANGMPKDWITGKKVQEVSEYRGAEFAGWIGADNVAAGCGKHDFSKLFAML